MILYHRVMKYASERLRSPPAACSSLEESPTHTSYELVATNVGGQKWNIPATVDANEKKAFHAAMEGKTPADFPAGGGGAPQQTTTQTVSFQQEQHESTGAKADGTVVKKDDGTIQVGRCG
jgi:hypothetical protein